MTDKEGQLRVWHIANPPGPLFQRDVTSVEEAKTILNLLADYDNHLGDNLVFSNAQGLEIFDHGEWVEWYDENDNDIAYVLRDAWDKRNSDAPTKSQSGS